MLGCGCDISPLWDRVVKFPTVSGPLIRESLDIVLTWIDSVLRQCHGPPESTIMKMVAVNCLCRNVSTPTIFVVAHPLSRAHELIIASFVNIHCNPSNENFCTHTRLHYRYERNPTWPTEVIWWPNQSSGVGCESIIIFTKKYDSCIARKVLLWAMDTTWCAHVYGVSMLM